MPAPLQITIQQLSYLDAVARTSSWAEAASELGVTPSALSQGLAELERRLDFEIFERRGRRRMVAPRAAPVLNYARQVLAQTGDLSRWIERTQTGQVGAVRVGMIDAAAVGHFSSVLQAFRAAHPNISFSLTVAPSADLLRDLLADRLDMVVVVKPPIIPPHVQVTDLLTEPLAVYAPPGSRPGKMASWGPWVAFPTTSHTRQLVETAMREQGVAFDVVAESNQPDVLREMVKLGLGWTVLPTIQAEIAGAPLQRVEGSALLGRTLSVVERRGAVINPLVQRLITELVRV